MKTHQVHKVIQAYLFLEIGAFTVDRITRIHPMQQAGDSYHVVITWSFESHLFRTNPCNFVSLIQMMILWFGTTPLFSFFLLFCFHQFSSGNSKEWRGLNCLFLFYFIFYRKRNLWTRKKRIQRERIRYPHKKKAKNC